MSLAAEIYPQSLVVEKHFLADETNTEWDIYLQMKTGSLHKGQGLNEGFTGISIQMWRFNIRVLKTGNTFSG
jgi:hypothetical protein